MSSAPRSWLLRRIVGSGPQEEEQQARARAEAQKSADRWQAKAERRGTRIAELEAALARAQEQLHEARGELRRPRRSGATPRVLADLVAVRARHVARLTDAAAASNRERMLTSASEAYAQALADPEARLTGLWKVDIDGVAWWVPVDSSAPERRERMAEQGFPLRAILKTRVLPLGGVMVDVGANIGRTSIPRVMLGDVQAVYAAEPEPANFACLVQNVVEHGLAGTVLPDQVAIGESRGEVRLRRSRFPGGHRVLHDPGQKAKSTVSVAQWPLEAWLRHLGVDLDAVTFIKVDTQGAERGVLLGAGSMLDRPHVAWQMEIEPALLARAGTPVAELLALLGSHFSHFLDVGGPEDAAPRPTRELADALAYVGVAQKHTDLLLYHAPV
jgi:FkbM family methyltransferase